MIASLIVKTARPHPHPLQRLQMSQADVKQVTMVVFAPTIVGTMTLFLLMRGNLSFGVPWPMTVCAMMAVYWTIHRAGIQPSVRLAPIAMIAAVVQVASGQMVSPMMEMAFVTMWNLLQTTNLVPKWRPGVVLNSVALLATHWTEIPPIVRHWSVLGTAAVLVVLVV